MQDYTHKIAYFRLRLQGRVTQRDLSRSRSCAAIVNRCIRLSIVAKSKKARRQTDPESEKVSWYASIVYGQQLAKSCLITITINVTL